MSNFDEFIMELEKKLNEKKMIEFKKQDLKNDITSFTDLIPELDSIIKELDKIYQKTKDPQDQKKLNEYINERKLYELSIQGWMREYQEIGKILSSNEATFEIQEKIVSLYYERREALLGMELLEKEGNSLSSNEVIVFKDESGRDCRVPLKSKEKYSEYMDQVIAYDDKILNYIDILEEPNLNVEEDFNIEISTIFTPIDKKSKIELEAEYDQVLAQLREIEQMSGRKCRFKTTFNGQKKEITIPKSKKGKYGSLLTKLHKIEEQLNKYKNNELVVRFDQELYNKMEELQKIAYLSNLKLQIENLPETYVKAYINEKYIPIEYKELYLEILNLLKPKKKVNYYSIPLNEVALENKSIEEKMDYYNELAYDVTHVKLVEPVNITLGGETYTVNKNDVPLIKKCYEQYNKLKLELQKEKERINTEQAGIIQQSTTSNNNIEITSNNQVIPINKEHQLQYCKNLARTKEIEDFFKDPIYFDSKKYESLSKEEQINYCKNLLNQILLREVKNPVEMNLDNQKVVIDSMCVVPFNKACEKLFEFRENFVDIEIDEKYVQNLSEVEKKAYYLLFMHNITLKPIKNEHIETFNNQIYKFDKKYLDIFNIAKNRYIELLEKEKKPVKVEKKKSARFLEKIKKSLKKKSVQIGLVLGLMASTFSLGFNMNKNNEKNKTEITYDEDLLNQQISGAVNAAVSKAVDEQNLDEIIEEAVKDALEKQSAQKNTEIVEEYNILGETFSLKEDANIYNNYNMDKEMQPKYKNDVYTTVGVGLQTKEGTIININYFDENANEIIKNLEANGATIIGRYGVASTGFENYLKDGVPTGTFREDDINKLNVKTELQEIISESLHKGRGV